MDLIISWINLVIALVSIVIGFIVLRRMAGKLRLAILSLNVALIIIVVREVLIILHIEQSPIAVGLMRLATILLILITMLSMRSIIKRIDHNHQKR